MPAESQSEERNHGRALPHQRVSAILVSHNGARWLPEVVAALSSQERIPDFIIAVDTGSRDGSDELLRNSRIDVLPAPVDSGFGSAIALAVSQLPPIASAAESAGANEREVEWLWLLHDDSAPAPDALAHLLSAVAKRPNVGVAGPKILGWHDRNHLLEMGVSIAHNGARWTGLERNERDQGQHDGDGVIPVLAVSTAGALIRRDLFEEVGGFDENLPLFRDDIDFGMRAHMAGYSVLCVTSARLFHAEAAATERRAIDVAGGTFHRPHLVDRRHAAFVLLANLPLWTLPWITLRVFTSSVIRAVGYLLAKLPGYALDELGAIALLFTRLDRLRSARNARRKMRLLPARVIRPLLAPWSEQIRLGFLRFRDLLLRRVEPSSQPVAGNVFTESDDAYEGELLAPVRTNFWRHTLSRPLIIATLPLLVLCLIAGRFRFGPLAGGALAQAGESAFAYLEFYSQSWHAIGLGSATPSHPLTPLLAIFSLPTGANPDVFITILFLFAPVFAFLSIYFFLRTLNTERWSAIVASMTYASSALMVSSINTGFASTLLLLVLLPFFAHFFRPVFKRNTEGGLLHLTWRRASVVTISLAIISAISFQIFIAVTLALLIHLALLKRQAIDRLVLLQRCVQYAVIILGSFSALAPWSLGHLLKPARLLMDQGVPGPLASPLHALLGNFLPFNQIPTYVMSATALIGAVALFSTRAFIDGIVIFSALFLAALISTWNVGASSNSVTLPIWPGGFLAISTFFAARVIALLGEGQVRRLRSSSLGRNHFTTVAMTIVTTYCIAANLFWWVSGAGSAPVRTVASSVLPPFIATATENPDRPKTLILSNRRIEKGERVGVQRFSYVVLRERDVRFGEVNSSPEEIPLLTKTVGEITAGAGDAPAAILADFGIRYLYLEGGRSKDSLARKIDGIGGLTRLSATGEGILWEVSGSTSRIKIKSVDVDGEVLEVPSERVGGEFDVPTAGRVQIAEAYDPRWRLLHGGKVLEAKRSELGLVEFDLPDAGRAVLFHDGTLQRAGISLQLAILGSLLFFALPRGRKQSELSDEEVS